MYVVGWTLIISGSVKDICMFLHCLFGLKFLSHFAQKHKKYSRQYKTHISSNASISSLCSVESKSNLHCITPWHVAIMEAVILKAMNIFDNEDKSKLEQDKLVQNIIVCWRSQEVSSVKEILPFSHKYFDTLEWLTLCM